MAVTATPRWPWRSRNRRSRRRRRSPRRIRCHGHGRGTARNRHDGGRRRDRQSNRGGDEKTKRDDRGEDHRLDEGQMHSRPAPARSRRPSSPTKRQRHHPQRPAADRRGPEADGDHHEDMVAAGQRDGEAGQKQPCAAGSRWAKAGAVPARIAAARMERRLSMKVPHVGRRRPGLGRVLPGRRTDDATAVQKNRQIMEAAHAGVKGFLALQRPSRAPDCDRSPSTGSGRKSETIRKGLQTS